ncbi:CD2-associated protein-like isoform X1 [Arapaima gigas]
MQHIYMQRSENFEVFTTVLSPQVYRARQRCAEDGEKVVVSTNYRAHWPDELELCQGDIIQVLYKDDKLWWFGRMQNGRQGYFPTTYVTSLSQKEENAKVALSSVKRGSVQDVAADVLGSCTGRCRLRAQRNREEEGLFLALRAEGPSPLTEGHTQSSPGLLHRFLSRPCRKSDCQGATNGAFQPD